MSAAPPKGPYHGPDTCENEDKACGLCANCTIPQPDPRGWRNASREEWDKASAAVRRKTADQSRADAIAALHTEWHGPECGGRCEVMRFVAALAPDDPTEQPLGQVAVTGFGVAALHRLRARLGTEGLVERSHVVALIDAALATLAPDDPTADHQWTTDDRHNYEWCRVCLLVRQANGSTDAKPCKGPARVGLRAPSNPAADEPAWYPLFLPAPADPTPEDIYRRGYGDGAREMLGQFPVAPADPTEDLRAAVVNFLAAWPNIRNHPWGNGGEASEVRALRAALAASTTEDGS